jgi:tRNA(fMet)-specific endonuclease VapC
MKYLLDTNICIYLIKQKPAEVIDKFKRFALGQVGISSITLLELAYGIEKSQYKEKNEAALTKFISSLVIPTFDEAAAFCYGRIRATLEKSRTPINLMDLLIAAHAKSRNLTLVTNNTKEFSRIKELRLENWVDDNFKTTHH